MTTKVYPQLVTHDGLKVPFHVVRFGKKGEFEAPSDKEEVVEAASKATDIFFFSHGWNNDWKTALYSRYIAFFESYDKMRKTHGIPQLKDYKPIMVGMYWPATVLADDSTGSPETGEDYSDKQFNKDIKAITTQLKEQSKAASMRFEELIAKPKLSEEEAGELVGLIASVAQSAEDELDFLGGDFEPQQIMADRARCYACAGQGSLSKLIQAPRWIFRVATYAKMRKRAAIVGSRGVGTLLQGLLDGTPARIHLLGHSYGAKVVLSALGATEGRKVQSVLLLQPAISHLAFASTIEGKAKAGRYYSLFDRVERPIMSTFSKHDVSLYERFHFYMSSEAQVGEWDDGDKAPSVPPSQDTTPSRYAALGGYGPHGLEESLVKETPIKLPGDPYSFEGSARLYALNGKQRIINGKKTKLIADHADVINDYTAWALYSLLKHGAAAAAQQT